MANNLVQLKTDIKTAFGANLDATTIGKVRNRFVSAYQSEWNIRVNGGVTDNAANRNTFAVDKVFDYMQEIYTRESNRENHAAVAAPETIV
jgi:hypothetical protein